MRFLKRIFASKEVKAAFRVLDEASLSFDGPAFYLVRTRIEEIILSDPNEFARIIQKGVSPHAWVYSSIANRAADFVESGRYHFYRGALNPIGKSLLGLFNAAADELVRIGAEDAEYIQKQKEAILENIRNTG